MCTAPDVVVVSIEDAKAKTALVSTQAEIQKAVSLAEAMGLTVARRGDLRKVMVEKSPADGHDWVTVVRSGLTS